MDNVLLGKFNRGEFAGKTQCRAQAFKKLAARICHKPGNRVRVRVQSDWWIF